MSERIDDLQYKGLKLIQHPQKFRFGTDSVELAHFVSARPGERAADLGAGTGILSVLLAARYGVQVTGIEIQEELADMARRSVALNGQSAQVRIECMPMQQAPAQFGRSFDLVVSNPPYRKLGSGFTQAESAVLRARHEVDVTLDEVIASAAGLLSTGGRFYMVYPTERMAEAIAVCQSYKLTPKIIQILRPAAGKPPHIFLLKCAFEGRPGLKVLPERDVCAYAATEESCSTS